MSVGKFKIEEVPKATGVVLLDDIGASEAAEYLRLKSHLRVAPVYYDRQGGDYCSGSKRGGIGRPVPGKRGRKWNGEQITILFSQEKSLEPPTFDEYLSCYHQRVVEYPGLFDREVARTLAWERDWFWKLCRMIVRLKRRLHRQEEDEEG